MCRRESSPSSRTIDLTLVGDVGLVRESRARVGPMHCDHLIDRHCSRKRLILVEQASSALSELLGTAAPI